jgi:iron(III) transport system ATP-binding protein
MIRIENIRKRFGVFEAVRGVSLDVPQGSFLVLVGPSGCGKSTMLRMLAGLEVPSAGTISYNGKIVSDGAKGWMIEPARRNNGLVFQSYALWPHMTVGGNVEWPLKVTGMAKPDRRERVDEVLGLLGIGALNGRYPNEISGGQQQRVAIARMIAPKPGILLFDEPLSNLDAKLRVEMRSELLRIHRATGATSVYVTHDQVEAMTMASHVAVMNEGRVEQFGSPAELVETPASIFVATFVGTPPANLVPLAMLPGKAQAADADHAMYRAQDITVSNAARPGSIALDFAEASPIAGRVMVTGTCGALRLTAVVDRAPAFAVGDKVHFLLPPNPSALFAATGERIS